MGKELTDVHMDDKLNAVVKSNGNPQVSGGTESKDYEVKECTSIIQDGTENQDVLDVKSTNFGTDIPDEKYEKIGDWKFTDDKKLSPTTSKSSGAEHVRVHNASKAGANGRASVNSTPSPTVIKTSERGSPLTTPMTRKLFQPFDMRNPDEEDNWSVASTYPFFGLKKQRYDAKFLSELYTICFELVLVKFSLAVSSTVASFRTARSRVTIGTAPTFKNVEHAQRRKEFYQKLEEKHQALEAERSQCEARAKEEQKVALKQLRKSMVVKANPIPSFYYKGPPPKVERRSCR
ncbi:protein WVD2-like 1 isoform X1 [Hibiscus syriacus]|uniref:protein WVD2-like 1 isoform X1 n=1 Tax=Hibiscus syriacus TaxID=106335 RepID=UPI001920D956|nr:protein WVD2-like 1 isoform X1 [Hibiscus syriacus]